MCTDDSGDCLGFSWAIGHAVKIGRSSFRRQRPVGPDAVAKSMDFIVSENTDLLSTTWRAPHFRGCIWHALT